MNKEIKAGDTWLISHNNDTDNLCEVTIENVITDAVKIDGEWYWKGKISFIQKLNTVNEVVDKTDNENVKDVLVEEQHNPESKIDDGWPWMPKKAGLYYASINSGKVCRYTWWGENVDYERAHRFNVFRTESEAKERAELDKRLAIHAALRQLGGGDEGKWVVRCFGSHDVWKVYDAFGYAPGEARFLTRESAQAALDVLLDREVLKHGEWE